MQNVIFGQTDLFGTEENPYAPNAGPSVGEAVSGGKALAGGNPALVFIAMIGLLVGARLLWETAHKGG